MYTFTDWDELEDWRVSNTEPECKCDIKQLMDYGHDKDCEYFTKKKVETKSNAVRRR